MVRFVLEELPFFCKETASVMSLKILFSFFLLQISFIFPDERDLLWENWVLLWCAGPCSVNL